MDSIRTQWDHTTKPSRFLVYKGDRVISDGTYKEGIQIFRDALRIKHKIQIQPYSFECGDGCCSEEGWRWFVNGEQVHSSPCYDAGWLAVLGKLGVDVELSGLDENGETTWSY